MKALPPSILANAGPLDPYPFPHVVIENALPWDYYWELHKTMIPLGPKLGEGLGPEITSVNNRFNAKPEMVSDPQWLDFIAWHESDKLLDEIERVFGYRVGGNNTIEVRQAGNFPSPGQKKYVLGPHVDGGGIWFVGLFYMGSPEDQEGGDLLLSRWVGERKWVRGNRAEDKASVPAKTIPYGHNIFAGWVNSNDALHEVSARKSTKYRRFVNILVRNPKVKLGGPVE